MQKIIDLIDAIRGCMANVSKKLNPEGKTGNCTLYISDVNLIKEICNEINISKKILFYTVYIIYSYNIQDFFNLLILKMSVISRNMCTNYCSQLVF